MQPFYNILIPTDFSQAAWRAVQLGMNMISPEESKITLLHVFPSSAKFTKENSEENIEDLKLMENIQTQMDEFCKQLQVKSSIEVVPKIIKGNVELTILDFILENDFDIVIMGVNSNGSDNQPGSHVNKIITNANAPVLVVPNHKVEEKLSA